MKPAGSGARLTAGPIGGTIFSLMVPMMLGMIAIIGHNVAGAFFIGQVGTQQLAAFSFTFPVSFIVGSISMGLGIGTSAVVARLFGQGRREEVQRITLHAILLGATAGVLVLIAGILTIDPVFRMLGADETTLPLIHDYMRIYYWGGIFLVVPMIANSVLRASGDAKRPAAIMTTAAVLNIALDPVLIFGLFGLPRLELEGAALASLIANVCTMGASVAFVIFRERLVDFSAMHLELLADSWRRILHVGLPSVTSSLIAPLTTAFITYQIAQFGQEAVAGFGVAARVEGMSLLAAMSLSGAMTPFVGQNFGAGALQRVQDGVNFAYRFSAMYGLTAALVLAVAGPWIAALFTDDALAQQTAVLHMRIVPISYFAFGISMTVNGSLNAIGRPMAAMFVSMSRTVLVYAPLAWLLAKVIGIAGVFVAASTASLVAGGIGFFWFRLALREKLAGMTGQTDPSA